MCLSPLKLSFECMLLLWAWVQVPFLLKQYQVTVQSHLWGWHKAGTRSWKCRPGSWPGAEISGTVPCSTVHPHVTVLCKNLLFVSQRITNDWETMFLVALLGWLWSVNPIRNLCSLCGFLLKSGFLENICVLLGNRSTIIRACWCLFTVCSVGKLW